MTAAPAIPSIIPVPAVEGAASVRARDGSGMLAGMAAPIDLPHTARRRRLKPLRDAKSYVKRGRARCFVCAIVERDPDYSHHLVFEDDSTIAFLAKSPPLWGHVLVAPKMHREQVATDFDETSYLALQRVVHSIGKAISRAVPCERLYVLSLGSQQLNRHVHWHVAPLPPGVPLPRQQLRAFSQVIAGVLECPDEEWAKLALRVREELGRTDGAP